MDLLQRQDGAIRDMKLNDILFFKESKRQMGKLPFNMAEFKQLYDIREQRDYLNSHALFIGAGTSRIAYGISPKWVIKLAGGISFKTVASSLGMVEAGAAQNAAEVENYNNASPEARKLLPRTVGGSSNFNWIITELVRPVTGFEEMRQLAFGNHQIVGEYGVIQTMGGLLQIIAKAHSSDDEYMQEQLEAIQAISEPVVGEFIDSVVACAQELQLGFMDLRRAVQWGESADGRLVLLDFGGTEDVLDEYY